MKPITKITFSAIAFFALTGSASALDCEVISPITNQVVGDASAALAVPETYNLNGQASCDTLSTAEINSALGDKADTAYVDSENDAQDAVIDAKADKTYVDSENDNQDAEIATKANTADVDAKNALQDGAIGGNASAIAVNSGLINDNAADIASNSSEISANSAAIDENAKGVAISLAIPDAFLDATENFSIAAGFGGTENETAFGAIGSARLDNTWSLYAGGGMSTDGDTYGWKAGARAGW